MYEEICWFECQRLLDVEFIAGIGEAEVKALKHGDDGKLRLLPGKSPPNAGPGTVAEGQPSFRLEEHRVSVWGSRVGA